MVGYHGVLLDEDGVCVGRQTQLRQEAEYIQHDDENSGYRRGVALEQCAKRDHRFVAGTGVC